METLREVLGLPYDSTQRAKYNANSSDKKISQIIIDGNTIKGYGAFSFLWEKSYIKSPTRSANGSIGNLNSYATFITPHLKIDFSLLFIDDYRKIMQLLYAKNEHLVQCYDIINDRQTTNNMYFATESMPVIYSLTRQLSGQSDPIIEVLGVRDYTVELIGTNTQLGGKTVTYNPNLPRNVASIISPITVDVVAGQEIIVGEGTESITDVELSDTDGDIWKFYCWSTASDWAEGTLILNGTSQFVYDSLTLYAVWTSKANSIYTISFDYGLGSPQLDEYGNAIYSREIQYGNAIGNLYVSPLPTVKFDGITYTPYERKGWYWTPKISEGSTQITSNTSYKLKGNATIYQIFEPLQYTIKFVSNGGTDVNQITGAYGSAVATPIPQRDNYTFEGWYYDIALQKKFIGTIPPYNATLYAKWSEKL